MFPLASGNKDLSKEVAQQRPQQETLLQAMAEVKAAQKSEL